MPAKLKLRASVCALGALSVLALGAPVANAASARFEGSSSDGRVAFFSTTEQLVSGDTDNRTDVYARYFDEAVGEGGAFVTRLVSLGPSGGNDAFDAIYDGASADGTKVFFSTRERLTADDTDNFPDVYMRNLDAKTTTLVSGTASGPFEADFVGMSTDGDRVFFSTEEKLTADDADEAFDVYVSEIGDAGVESIERVSKGANACAPACGNGAEDAGFLAASSDGKEVAFQSSEPLAGQSEAKARIYLREMADPGSEQTRLVSPSGDCPEGVEHPEECDPSFGGISADGSHVFFETSAQVTGDDTDKAQDVYAWSNGTVTRASTGPDGGNGEADANALFAGAVPDGSAVFFETGERLDPAADEDQAQDIYERDLASEATTLVSQGEAACRPGCGNGNFDAGVVEENNVPHGVTIDGADTRVFFFSKEKLTADDTDAAFDVYVRDLGDGETIRVSRGAAGCEPACGNGSFDASFSAASEHGSRAFFVTAEGLDGEDLDVNAKDIYERNLETGTTTRISRGESGICGTPPCDNGPKAAQLHGISADGAVAFFVSEERLTADAAIAEDKVYSRSAGVTRLVSNGNPAGLQLAPPPPALTGTSPESPASSNSPKLLGSAEAGSFVKIYETADCSGEPVATGAAATLSDPGIGVSVETGATVTFRATAEADGFVSDCSDGVAYRQREEESGGGGSGSGGGGGGGGTRFSRSIPTEAPRVLTPIPHVTPKTRITFGPAAKTRLARPVFRFVDSTGQPGTSFSCKLDRRRWRACGSPIKLPKLARGKHIFRVKGMNAVGVSEANGSKRAFKEVHR